MESGSLLVSRSRWVAGPVHRRPHCPAYRVHRRGRAAAKAVTADQDFPPPEPVIIPSSRAGVTHSRDSLHEVSPEFRALCQHQVSLLLGALHASLLAAATGQQASSSASSYGNGSGEAAEDQPGSAASEGAAAVHGTCLSCAVYCRSAPSIESGQLQLQLVAHSGAGAEGGPAGGGGGRGVDQWGRQCLFLERGELSLEDQEQWIVEQSIIVLPESGGLVLPLAYNGFLMGLLVVERGSHGDDLDSGLGPLLQPPTCTLFGSRDFQLLRQGASVLALACAMDLRASLERAGNVTKQRHVRGLVQQARKPLSTLRTLGAMLAPRLQEGEPDRDMAEGIMAQGDRLAELVSQLQAALHPPLSSPLPRLPVLDPTPGSSVLGGPGSSAALPPHQPQHRGGPVDRQEGTRLYPALPSASIGSDSVVRTIDLDAGEWAPAPGGGGASSSTAAAVARVMGYAGPVGGTPALPAAPSTSADDAGAASTTDTAGAVAGSSNGALPMTGGPVGSAAAVHGDSPSGSGSNGSSSDNSNRASSLWPSRPGSELGPQHGQTADLQPGNEVVMPEELPRTDLLNVLMPLLSTAYIFCSANGIRFHMLPSEHIVRPRADDDGSEEGQSGNGASTGGAGARTTGLLCVDVVVAPAALKRMLSQLVDGIIACAARGDCVEVALVSQRWRGVDGVAVTLGCLQDLGVPLQGGELLHPPPLLGLALGQGGAGLGGLIGLEGQGGHPPLGRARRPEFAFLSSSASAAGGWFDVVEDDRHMQQPEYGSVVAVLWLPVAEA